MTEHKKGRIEPGMIDDVRFGCCLEPGDSLNVARIGALLAGIPDSVTAVTINRVCTSEWTGHLRRDDDSDRNAELFWRRTEHMSGIAYTLQAQVGMRLQDQVFVDT